MLGNNLRPWALRLGVQVRPAGCSEHQVLKLGVDEGEHDGAGTVQDGAALDHGPGLGEPRLGLEAEVDCVQGHGEEVSDQGHGLRVQSGGGKEGDRWRGIIRPVAVGGPQQNPQQKVNPLFHFLLATLFSVNVSNYPLKEIYKNYSIYHCNFMIIINLFYYLSHIELELIKFIYISLLMCTLLTNFKLLHLEITDYIANVLSLVCSEKECW